MSIFQYWLASLIHKAANHAISKNSCQSYFKSEVLFSRREQGAIRTDWKIWSYIFYHLSLVVTIYQVATLLSIFSSTRPSLAQNRKQMKSNYIFTYANWNINLHHRFWKPRLTFNRSFYLSHVLFISAVYIIHLL